MFKTIKDFDFEGKKVLVRCDFNVPISETGEILDDFRIKQALPTIKYLLEKKAIVVLLSHLGEPDGKVVENLRLNKVREKLSELLGDGKVTLLENVRFDKREYENDLGFAKELAEDYDIFVNEAFSVCHRTHASIVGIPKFLPSCAGLLLEKEINNLDKVLQNPEHPMTAIVGGKKVETKAKFIDKISEIADFVITSGLIEKEILDKNIKLKHSEKILAPVKNLEGKDIDQETADLFKNTILKSKTIIWNGPVGKIEDPNYKKGTLEIAKAIIESGAFCAVGGGETVEFIKSENLMDKFSHVSTGGGAMLAYLSGEKLSGIEALNNQK